MIHICTQCRHFRPPQPISPFGGDEALSPGMLKAEREWMEESEQRRAEEQRRFESRAEFHYEPEFFAWCSDRTPSSKQLRALQASLEAGDGDALKEASKELRFFADPSRGVIVAIYELCAVRNMNGDCDGFKPPKEAEPAPAEPPPAEAPPADAPKDKKDKKDKDKKDKDPDDAKADNME